MILWGVLALLVVVAPAQAQPPIIYENTAAVQWVYISPYPPYGRGYCDAATNVMALVVPGNVGDVLDIDSVIGLSMQAFGQAAVVGWAIHVEPFTRGVPVNADMICNETWIGEDVNWSRPYLMARAAKTATITTPGDQLVLLRVYGGSGLGPGYLQTMNVQGSPTARLTVRRFQGMRLAP